MDLKFDAKAFRDELKAQLDGLTDDELVAIMREGFSDAVRERAREIAVFVCAERLQKLVEARGDEIVAQAAGESARGDFSIREAVRSLARRFARESVDRSIK